MSFQRMFYIYIMASDSGTLYVGFTNNIFRRTWEHKNGINKGFTKKYKCHKLVYCEQYYDAGSGIAREKQIKKWRREKKVALIKQMNPRWRDLSADFVA